MFRIELGTKVKDVVTGFKGTVTGRAEYLTGCRQYCVIPKSEGNKAAEGNWFDEQRLEVIDNKQVALASQPAKAEIKGGPQDAPPAR